MTSLVTFVLDLRFCLTLHLGSLLHYSRKIMIFCMVTMSLCCVSVSSLPSSMSCTSPSGTALLARICLSLASPTSPVSWGSKVLAKSSENIIGVWVLDCTGRQT